MKILNRVSKQNKTNNIETQEGTMMSNVSHSLHGSGIELANWMEPHEFRRFVPLLERQGMGKSFVHYPLADSYTKLASKNPQLLSDYFYVNTLYNTVMSGQYQNPHLIMDELTPHFSEFAKQNDIRFLDIAEKLYKNNFPGDSITAIEIAKHYNHKRATTILKKLSVVNFDGTWSRRMARTVLKSQGRSCGVLSYLGTLLTLK